MQPNTYPDGFPLNALEAITAAYFLSDGEKTEWRDWLKTATQEQESELVSILHQMWEDAQKTAVPESFAQPQAIQDIPTQQFQSQPVEQSLGSIAPAPSFAAQPPAPTQVTPPPTPVIENPFAAPAVPVTVAAEPQMQAPAQIVEPTFNQASFNTPAQMDIETEPEIRTQKPETQVTPEPQKIEVMEETQPQPIESTNPYFTVDEEDDKEDTIEQQEDTLKKMADTPFTSNPILEDTSPTTFDMNEDTSTFSEDDFGAVVSNNTQQSNKTQIQNPKKSNQQSNTQQQNQGQKQKQNQPQPQANKNQNQQSTPQNRKTDDESQKAFSITLDTRKSVTQEKLESVYKQYAKIKDEYANAFDRYEQNQSEFLNKVMEVVINFESISTYYDSIMSKLFEMNSKIVQQAKEIAEVKSQIDGSRSQATLPEQIDEVRDALEKLKEDLEYNSRDVRNFRNDSRARIADLSSQFAAFSSDTYKQEGILSRLDIMRKEIFELQKLNGTTSDDEKVKPKFSQLPEVSHSSNNNQIMNKMNPSQNQGQRNRQVDSRQRVNPNQNKQQ